MKDMTKIETIPKGKLVVRVERLSQYIRLNTHKCTAV